MCEHKERYLDFIEYLNDCGYVVIIHDHRGHGKSVLDETDLGYFYGEGARAIVEDVHQLTNYIKKKYPNLPVCLFGHSMGSLVVRNYIQKYDHEINALIVCGSPSKNKLAGLGKLLCKAIAMVKGISIIVNYYRKCLLVLLIRALISQMNGFAVTAK